MTRVRAPRPALVPLGALALLAGPAALPLASPLLGCGGCPRTRSSSAHATLPAGAADLILEDTVAIDASAGPPLVLPLDAASVREVVTSQARDVRHCFESARAEHPAIAGTVLVDLDIDPSGVVRAVRVPANETGDGVLSDCVAALARHWHFPASPHGARARIPFELEEPPPPPQAEAAEAAPAPTPPPPGEVAP